MKSIWREICLALLMGMILPGITTSWAALTGEGKPVEETSPPTVPETIPRKGPEVTLRRSDGTQVKLDMEEYLVGVILAEMPSTFEQEAKKAQAVAARTYARKAMLTGGKHGDGSLCALPGCCQAWISREEYLNQGGRESALDAARAAVGATSGLVLTYEGGLIEATYFSCSGGQTEDAVAVWGAEFPYLKSVESPGEENAAHYTDTVYISKSEFAEKTGIPLTGAPETWFSQFRYTPGGGVDTVSVCGTSCAGTFLRSKLGLRSTAFTLEPEEDGITIHTRGFGHRVGMSQYGADAMALSGSDFREILAYYYPGTTLELTNGPG